MSIQLLIDAGPIAWLIIALGIMAAMFFVGRTFSLRRARVDTSDLLHGIFTSYDKGNIREAIIYCQDTPGPVARLLAIALENRDLDRESLIDRLDVAGRAEISRMERRLSFLGFVAQAAPVLGLLGTVMNILDVVQLVQKSSPITPIADLAARFAPGVVSTAVGLVVAIPAYAAFNYLIVCIDRIVLDMEESVALVLHHFEERKASA